MEMIVRKFESEDYEEVYALVLKNQGSRLPHKLGGVGVVVEEDKKIVAFAWALASPDSDIACVEFFAVDEAYRDKKIYGPTVITRLLIELNRLGKSRIIGLLTNESPYTKSLLGIYSEVGMIANAGYCVHGDIQKVLAGISRRYGGNNGINIGPKDGPA